MTQLQWQDCNDMTTMTRLQWQDCNDITAMTWLQWHEHNVTATMTRQRWLDFKNMTAMPWPQWHGCNGMANDQNDTTAMAWRHCHDRNDSTTMARLQWHDFKDTTAKTRLQWHLTITELHNLYQLMVNTNDFVDPLSESKSWSGTDIQEQKQQEATFAKPHPPPRDGSAESASRRRPKVRSSERQNRTPADAHLKPATNTNGKSFLAKYWYTLFISYDMSVYIFVAGSFIMRWCNMLCI